MLELDGWRRVRTDLKHLRGMGVQEPGMADDLFIRYVSVARAKEYENFGWAEVMWIEWKKKGGRAGDHQLDWQNNERYRGARVLLAGQHFAASIEGFRDWYKASSLMRGKILS